jgi:type III secretion protein I
MEIGSVAGQVLQSTLSEGAGATAVAGKKSGEASPDAVSALEKAMESGGNPAQGNAAGTAPGAVEQAGTVPTEAAPRIQPVEPATGTEKATLGDRILDGLGQVQHDTKAALDHVQSTLNSGDINAADMMRAQYELMQVSIQQDVTAKVVGKATQTVDTFLKNQ